MRILKPCPCGKTPKSITVEQSASRYKWAMAVPDCCGMWEIEFRTVDYDEESEATKQRAIAAWNEAPRGK